MVEMALLDIANSSLMSSTSRGSFAFWGAEIRSISIRGVYSVITRVVGSVT